MSNLKNTDDDEQLNLNSPLSSLPGKNPFHVDDSYFDAFTTKLNNTIAELEELKAEAPRLSSIPKYNPFEVPAGYFDELPSAIQGLVTIEKSRFSIKEWLFQFIRPNFSIPVFTVIAIAIAAIHFVNQQVAKTPADLTADLSLEEQLYPIDESILIDLLSKSNEESDLKQSPTVDSITNYLIDNDVDDASLNTDLNTIDHENQ